MTSADVRERLIEALRLDLIGPEPGGEHAGEVLPMPPSRWYLTGFLMPYEGGEAQRTDFAAQAEVRHAGRTRVREQDVDGVRRQRDAHGFARAHGSAARNRHV